MTRVLSFDIGLRNLAAAVIRADPEWSFPREYASDTETLEAFKHRAFVHFLHNGWILEQWQVMDVTQVLDGEVKRVKKLGIINQAVAVTDTLEELDRAWFADSAPDVIAVEVQHNANADMRAVCFGILVFFRRTMRETELVAVSGSHKLKVCEALGFAEGSGARLVKRRRVKLGLEDGDEAGDEDEDEGEVEVDRAQGRGPSFGKRWSPTVHTRKASKHKYTDNKNRALLAVKSLLEAPERFRGLEVFAKHSQAKHDDLADALLQGLWVLWTKVVPRAPARRFSKPKK